jgi:ribosomal protein L35
VVANNSSLRLPEEKAKTRKGAATRERERAKGKEKENEVNAFT